MNLVGYPGFDAGYQAYMSGLTRDDNPHDDYMLRMAWFQGWEEAWLDDK